MFTDSPRYNPDNEEPAGPHCEWCDEPTACVYDEQWDRTPCCPPCKEREEARRQDAEPDYDGGGRSRLAEQMDRAYAANRRQR